MKNNKQSSLPKKKKNTKKNNVGRKVKIQNPRPYVRFSSCAKQYALALANPWRSISPCIPDGITIPSHKLTLKGRGKFTVGTGGTGFIYFNPFYSIQNDIGMIAPNYCCAPIYFTTANYPQTGAQVYYNADTFNAGITSANLSGPFTRNNLLTDHNIQYRLVGAGLKVAYIGTELNLGGEVILAQSKTGQNLAGFQASSQVDVQRLLRDPNNARLAETDRRKEHFVSFVPGRTQHLSYVCPQEEKALYGVRPGEHLDYGYCLAVFVDGAVATSSYTWDVVAHFEIVGDLAMTSGMSGGVGGGAGVTPSHSDPIGVSGILSSLPTILPSGTPEGFANQLISAAKDSILWSSTMVTGAAAAYLGHMTGNRIMDGL